MTMNEKITTYTSSQLAAMCKAGLSKTDWVRVNTASDAVIDAAMTQDDEEITDQDWQQAVFTVPLTLDREMYHWLGAQGHDYQSHIRRLIQEEMKQHS